MKPSDTHGGPGTRFEQWALQGGNEMRSAVLRAAEVLTPAPRSAGFVIASKAFDASNPPSHALNLERSSENGVTEYINISVDKHRRARLQVLFGSKQTAHPHRWVRAGALVWKKGREDQKHKWWGARWWHVDKWARFNEAVDVLAGAMPQVVEYLNGGTAGPNVLVEFEATATHPINSAESGRAD